MRLSKPIPVAEEERDFILPALPASEALGLPCVLPVHLNHPASQSGAAMGSTVPQRSPYPDLPRGSLLPTGVFIYPLEQSEVVASFEAAAGSRRVTFQVQNRHRAQDCCLQCIPNPGQPQHCAGGKCCCTGDSAGPSWLGGSKE